MIETESIRNLGQLALDSHVPSNNSQISTRWSIRFKIMDIAICLLVLFIMISGFSTFRLLHIKHELADLSDYTIPITDAVSIIRVDLIEQEVHLQRIFKYYEQVPIDSQIIEKEVEKYQTFVSKITASLKRAEKLANQGEKNAEIITDVALYKPIFQSIEKFEAKYQKVNAHGLDIIAALKTGEIEVAKILEDTLADKQYGLNGYVKSIFQTLDKLSSESISAAEAHEQEVFGLRYLQPFSQ